jgi:hypothetical protein
MYAINISFSLDTPYSYRASDFVLTKDALQYAHLFLFSQETLCSYINLYCHLGHSTVCIYTSVSFSLVALTFVNADVITVHHTPVFVLTRGTIRSPL